MENAVASQPQVLERAKLVLLLPTGLNELKTEICAGMYVPWGQVYLYLLLLLLSMTAVKEQTKTTLKKLC